MEICEDCNHVKYLLNPYNIFLHPHLSPKKGEIMKKKVELRLSHPESSKMFLCEQCLSWDGEFHIEASMNCEALWIQVSCLCNSIKCKICKNTRLMPASCVWNLENNYFEHVPNLTERKPCSKCGSSQVIN